MSTRRRHPLRLVHRCRLPAAALALLFPLFALGHGAASAATPGEDCDRVAAFNATPSAKSVSYEALDADLAIRLCDEAVKSMPNEPRYRFLLSRALLKAGRHQEARDEAERAVAGGERAAHVVLYALYAEGLGVPKDPAKALKHLKAAAEAGVSKAQIEYALILEEGREVNKDLAESARWMRAAAEAGDAEGEAYYAQYLHFGKGMAKDDTAAAAWARRSAEKGHAFGQFLLAVFYDEGAGLAKDVAAAASWYRKAAEQGHGDAAFLFAAKLERGEGVAKNEIEAAQWYRKLANDGDTGAQARLARLLIKGPPQLRQPAEAIAWYEKAAAQNNPIANYELGEIYLAGELVPKDTARGLDFHRAAAKAGYASSMVRLAMLGDRGVAGAPDKQDAVRLLERAVEKNDAFAMALLGQRYESGNGVGKDPKRAFALYEKAAANDSAYGESLLAKAYHQGLGVKQDIAAAAAHYERAAAMGDPSAAAALGKLLLFGGPGVAVNQVKAVEYLNAAKAAFQSGSYQSLAWFAEVARDLAWFHTVRGEYGDAEAILQEALGQVEAAGGDERYLRLRLMGALANTYEEVGRYEEAGALFAAVLDGLGALGGEGDLELLGTLTDYALLEERLGRYDDAAKTIRSVKDRLKVPKEAAGGLAIIDASLARVLAKDGRYADADALLTAALKDIDRLGMAGMPHAVRALADRAYVKGKLGKLAEAEALYRKASAQLKSAGIEDHPLVLAGSIDFAEVLDREGKTGEALSVAREATARYAGRLDRQGRTPRAQLLAERKSMRDTFIGHIALLERQQGRPANAALLAESFDLLQLANAASVSESIGHGAARSVAGSGALSTLTFERQKTVETWSRLNRQLASALVEPGNAAAAQLSEMKALETSLARIDQEIKRDFPRYFDLTQSAPVPLAEAQKLLKPDEAIVAYALGRDGAYAWAVTPVSIVLRRLDRANARSLEDDIAAVRLALDPSDIVSEADLKPVDLGRLHGLYGQLLAPLDLDWARVRHLLVVPDGPLNALPFHVLVTEPAAAAGSPAAYRSVAWLARRTAVTVLPSLGALRALRASAPVRASARPFIGFGDPVFGAETSMAARGGKGIRRGLPPSAVAKRGSVDLAALRALPALPDTADELKRIATLLAAENSVFLQAEASEARVKRMDLSQYRILALATHGLISGDLNGLDEPALALSVPAQASAEDDGLLTASEVALLNLNADWVILSACNTASGDGRPGAEGLSGLARAFFVAGSRALLVSNWPVLSDAAAEVTTRMIERLKAEPALRRSEALRLAMMALLDDAGAPDYMGHPAAWAPFVVVGDGAPLRSP